MTFEAAAFTGRGTQRERVALPGELFDGTVNMPVMHQAVKAFLANQRQGNASTKTRGLVTGGNQKPWKQKGTGRARQGSTRAPHWVGGGTVFGPTPRAYDEFVPRQVRALARKSAFNARARENAVIVVDRFDFEAPKTSRMQALINSLGVAGQKVLVLTDGVKPNVFLSARNLPTTHVMPYSDVSTYHVLWSDVVVIEGGAIGQTLEPIAESETATRSSRKPAPAKRTTSKGADRARREAAEAAERGDATPAKADSKAKARSTAKKSATKKTAAKKASAKSGTKAPAAKKSTAKKSAAKKSSKKKGGE
jgi:large subunit ribosomal protein L4